MKLVYSWQALADLDAIAIYYVAHATPAVAEAIGLRLHEVTERIRRVPEAAPRVSQRSHIRVVAGRPLSVPNFLSGARRRDRYFACSAHLKKATERLQRG